MSSISELEAFMGNLVDRLKELEWSGTAVEETDYGDDNLVDCCPACGALKPNGHHQDCQIAAVLAKAGKAGE